MKQKKINWLELSKATLFVLAVVVTIVFTWGLPQMLSYGASNFPAIPLDDKIPLITEFVWIYYFTFPLGIITIYILYFKNREALWEVIVTLIIACIISMVFYFVYPTEMIKPALDPVSLSDRFTISTWNASRPVCCLPSQHCFMALSCIIASINEKNTHWFIRVFTALCGVLIIMSTVFIKQHYFLDFIASFCIIVPLYVALKLLGFGKKCEKKIFKVKY